MQAETAAAKERFSKVEEERVGRLSEEERLEVLSDREQRREPEQEDGISFTRLRVTDFLSNKRVGQPPKLGEEDEVKVESKKCTVVQIATK